jgi:hypothetical protein
MAVHRLPGLAKKKCALEFIERWLESSRDPFYFQWSCIVIEKGGPHELCEKVYRSLAAIKRNICCQLRIQSQDKGA